MDANSAVAKTNMQSLRSDCHYETIELHRQREGNPYCTCTVCGERCAVLVRTECRGVASNPARKICWWAAHIKKDDGTWRFLGYPPTHVHAALAYNQAAYKLYGKDAVTYVVPEKPTLISIYDGIPAYPEWLHKKTKQTVSGNADVSALEG